jgi:hypothetical protein
MVGAPWQGVAKNPTETKRSRLPNKQCTHSVTDLTAETDRYGNANYKMKISNFVSKSPSDSPGIIND